MSQAALNTRNSEEEVSSRRNNGTRLAGILFLLTVLTTVLVSGWVVLGWMEDAQRLPLSKLVLTGERHYTRNDDIRQSIWHWVSGYLYDPRMSTSSRRK